MYVCVSYRLRGTSITFITLNKCVMIGIHRLNLYKMTLDLTTMEDVGVHAF